MKRELELYIHIPFCVKKCAYCDFLSGPTDEKTVVKYVEALEREIESYRKFAKDYEVTTIFFGGGTPSLLDGTQMMEIMNTIRDTFLVKEDAEITMEANPGTVTEENLLAYKEVKINRISFGLQSAKNEELRMLGRIHTFEEFLESYELAKRAGFSNINVDLISAIPGQTLTSWEETLRAVVSLEPGHISAYSLIVEEGTPFAKLYGEGGSREEMLPSEEEERRIYERTEEILKEAGYHRYEISNYAKDGFECRHNLGYWGRKEYLGLGLGASSLIHETRFHNTECMESYLKNAGNGNVLREDEEVLTTKEQMEEFVFLGLRKAEGIKELDFEEKFGKSIWECYGDNLRKVMGDGLLIKKSGCLKLTKKGIDVSNYVFAEILWED